MNFKQRPGWLNRHVAPLPTEPCIINIVYREIHGEEIYRCAWEPYKPTPTSNPAKGYLGKATRTEGVEAGFFVVAWDGEDGEFLYYQTV